jgi:putative oxidoreductase
MKRIFAVPFDCLMAESMKSIVSVVTNGTASIAAKCGVWTALPLRLIVGYGFMAHGYSKLSGGPDHFAGILQAIGVPSPEVMAWATIAVELLGGFAVIIGAFVTLASIPMVIVLVTAIVTVHFHFGFSSIRLLAVTPTGVQFGPVGYEVDLLYIACLVALVLGGAGPLSVDKMLASSKPSAKT